MRLILRDKKTNGAVEDVHVLREKTTCIRQTDYPTEFHEIEFFMSDGKRILARLRNEDNKEVNINNVITSFLENEKTSCPIPPKLLYVTVVIIFKD